jgi:hypothetical protein
MNSIVKINPQTGVNISQKSEGASGSKNISTDGIVSNTNLKSSGPRVLTQHPVSVSNSIRIIS